MMTKWAENQSRKWMPYMVTVLIVVSLGALLQMVVLSDKYKGLVELGRLFYLGIWTAILLPMVACSKKYILMFVFYTAIFVSAAYVPFFGGANVAGKEITSAYLLGASHFLFWTWIYGAARKIPSDALRRFACGFSFAALAVAILMPLLVWGYWIVSGGYVLSSAIVLTLFQTNLAESLAYLKNQNVFLWICGSLGLFFAVAGTIKALRVALHVDVQLPDRRMSLLFLFFMLIGLFVVNHGVKYYLPAHIGMEVKVALQQYRAYGEARAMREERLKNLQGLNLVSSGGVFVLVIGEAETRNHMQVYGYARETTPWMKDQCENKENVTFSNAYSNYVHTVPALTYALSEKNQYNAMDLKDAYSIVEVANAVGYETYWISNQKKLGVADTPVSETASTAQHQKWMNGMFGNSQVTEYYDDILLTQIPQVCEKNALIIIHLMGCHADYRDRCPNAHFSGEDSYVDQYDDAVLYNDYILSQIYERVHSLPNFKGMVYFSDHGEDPDRRLYHEATKFTWSMARIPLVMWFSDAFQEERPDVFARLKAHEQAYWTNDMIYDVMIDVLGIEGLPHMEPQHDLASTEYEITKENAMTLHGTLKLADEDVQAER